MEFYKINEVINYKFMQLPKIFFIDNKYKKLSITAKVIYSLLLDRMHLSEKNNWVNKNNEIYLVFSREALSVILNISKPTITTYMKELKKFNLIKEERLGRGRMNLIYIAKVEYESDSSMKLKNLTSRSKKTLSLEVKNFNTNNTNINNTNIKIIGKEKIRYKRYEQRDYDIEFLNSFYDNL